jgi:cyclopropane-fatty-acyl-phospholipid synthase
MMMTKEQAPATNGKLSLAEILATIGGGGQPLKFTAYDGSSAGPDDAVTFGFFWKQDTATGPGWGS